MNGEGFSPIVIPGNVWDQESTATILRNRDIAGLFKLATKYTGASQVRLSVATGIPQGRISQISRGQRQVSDLVVFERIANGLGLPDHARVLLGLAPLGPAASARADDDEHQEQADDLAARLDAASVIDSTMVMILSTDTNNLRMLDRRMGAGPIADKMRAHIAQINRAHHHAVRPGVRAELAEVLAEASSLAGWQAIDTGAVNDAWDHYERAKSAAQEAERPAVLAHVSGEQAYTLIEIGRPAEAVELIRYVHQTHRGQIPALLRAWLSAAEAEAASVLGDEVTCRNALDQAARLLPEDDWPDPELPYLALNRHHLARWRGNCLVRFADPDTVEDLRGALAGMDGTFNRAEAGVRCDLGHALLAGGDPDAALPHIQRAQQLATMTGSRRQRRRVDELARLLNRSLN
ncbi:XRE family transcriptional regulator [Herbidospora sp. NBRC 101105]|uniref:XRE family transcriptional regulator n=1 Tax=Herbidospora sp. NBRC 101105 TaxID=3032195 RepID=UPI0024A57D1A|nr:XRE family transcriptional regulator [Herbidospora sp. NBRC 101105]GLX96763.1 hypothetical protein Hesp01_47130 [Herbidospora sp. NBRC 101105]